MRWLDKCEKGEVKIGVFTMIPVTFFMESKILFAPLIFLKFYNHTFLLNLLQFMPEKSDWLVSRVPKQHLLPACFPHAQVLIQLQE